MTINFSIQKLHSILLWQCTVLMAFSIFVVAGCNSKTPHSAELVEINGEVLLDGEAVEHVRILFVPTTTEQESDFSLSYGETDSQGKFTMKLRDGTLGAIEGLHHVFFSKIDIPIDDSESENDADSNDLKANRQAASDSNDAATSDSAKKTFRDVTMFILPMSNDEQIPSYYNRYTDVTFRVTKGRGTMHAKFALSSVDPLLLDSPSN